MSWRRVKNRIVYQIELYDFVRSASGWEISSKLAWGNFPFFMVARLPFWMGWY